MNIEREAWTNGERKKKEWSILPLMVKISLSKKIEEERRDE